jgi:hypothetical protein
MTQVTRRRNILPKEAVKKSKKCATYSLEIRTKRRRGCWHFMKLKKDFITTFHLTLLNGETHLTCQKGLKVLHAT